MVERYNADELARQGFVLYGEFVLASDYDALAAENAEMQKQGKYDEASIRKLEAALRTYAAHRPSCPRSVRPPGAASCTCGLYDLLEGSASRPDNLSDGVEHAGK